MAIQDDRFASLLGFSSNAIEGAFLDLRNSRVVLITENDATFDVPLTAATLEAVGNLIVGGDADVTGDVDANNVTAADTVTTLDVQQTNPSGFTEHSVNATQATAGLSIHRLRVVNNSATVGTLFLVKGGGDSAFWRFDVAVGGVNQPNVLKIGTGTNANVGINEANPSHQLDVNGDARVQGYLLIGAASGAAAPSGSVFFDTDVGGSPLSVKDTGGTLRTVDTTP